MVAPVDEQLILEVRRRVHVLAGLALAAALNTSDGFTGWRYNWLG